MIEYGIDPKNKLAVESSYIANLLPEFFNRALAGNLSTTIAANEYAAIAMGSLDHGLQNDYYRIVKANKQRLTKAEFTAIADSLRNENKNTATQTDLFGNDDGPSTIIIKSKLIAAIEAALKKQLTVLKVASNKDQNQVLNTVGDVAITVAEQKKQKLAIALNTFKQLRAFKGPIASRLETAAIAIANGDKPQKWVTILLKEMATAIA